MLFRSGMTLLSNNTQVGDEGTLGNTKIFEFMDAGLPVICSNNKIWKEIVEGYKCGIAISPNNVNEIVQAINNIINNNLAITTMGENGKKAVSNVFNWNSQEDELLELYNSL